MSSETNIIVLQPRPAKVADPEALLLRRPKLLMVAARAGQAGWRRKRDLHRLLKCDDLPSHRRALQLLLAQEAHHNQARLARRGEHDLRTHILHLIAILAELRGLAKTTASPQTFLPSELLNAHERVSRAHP